MADDKAGPTSPLARSTRPDRLYLGWQYALVHPDPGPPPKRPTPPPQEQVSEAWIAAQRREDSLVHRPVRTAFRAALGGAALFLALWLFGALGLIFAGVGVIACLAVAALTGHTLWQGERGLRARIAAERQRLARIRAEQERRLFAAQREHEHHYLAWRARRQAYDRQSQWYAVAVPDDVDRIEIAGGTLTGWAAAVTMLGAARLDAGGEVTVLDLSEGAVAADIVEQARRRGEQPLVWLLPADLPRLDLGRRLGREATADVLSLTVSASEERPDVRDLSIDNAILERVLDVFDDDVTIAQITAALRALAQVGDPREDLRRGLLDARQLERLATMFGRGATDRVVIERAWALESQLRKLEDLGSEAVPLPHSPLRVISTDRRAGVFANKVTGTYATAALTHVLRATNHGRPWRHTVFVAGADKLRGDVLDRLVDACESTGTGLVLLYRAIPTHVRERLGRGNAAVAFMRLGNAEDARVASDHIGAEHRFVLSQLTETLGATVTDTLGDSYTSTVGSSDAVATSASTTSTRSRSRGRGRSEEGPWLGLGEGRRSTSRDSAVSRAISDTESLTRGVSENTTWGRSTAQALGSNESRARTTQRSRELLVEPHELQRLPVTAMIVTYGTPQGRRVVLADANPGILTLPTATLRELEDLDGVEVLDDTVEPSRETSAAPPVDSASARLPLSAPSPPTPASRGRHAASWDAEPPNLGPPPRRLDWRGEPR